MTVMDARFLTVLGLEGPMADYARLVSPRTTLGWALGMVSRGKQLQLTAHETLGMIGMIETEPRYRALRDRIGPDKLRALKRVLVP